MFFFYFGQIIFFAKSTHFSGPNSKLVFRSCYTNSRTPLGVIKIQLKFGKLLKSVFVIRQKVTTRVIWEFERLYWESYSLLSSTLRYFLVMYSYALILFYEMCYTNFDNHNNIALRSYIIDLKTRTTETEINEPCCIRLI